MGACHVPAVTAACERRAGSGRGQRDRGVPGRERGTGRRDRRYGSRPGRGSAPSAGPGRSRGAAAAVPGRQHPDRPFRPPQMGPVLLSSLLLLGLGRAAPPDHEVTYLPGLSKQPSFRHFSGYLCAGPGKYLHYWYVGLRLRWGGIGWHWALTAARPQVRGGPEQSPEQPPGPVAERGPWLQLHGGLSQGARPLPG